MAERIQHLSKEQANDASRALLEQAEKGLGFVPNLFAVMAHSTPVLEAYFNLGDLVKKGNFSAQYGEQLALAIAEENTCDYCLSAHSAIAAHHKLTKEEILESRKGQSEDEKKSLGLSFAQQVVRNRGQIDDEAINKLKAASFSDAEILEIVLHVVYNTLTNYVNHIAKTDIDFPVAEPITAAAN